MPNTVVNTVTPSVNTIMGQMTEMSQRKKTDLGCVELPLLCFKTSSHSFMCGQRPEKLENSVIC